MNNVKQSIVALLLGSSVAFAGGDVAPIVEPEIVVPEVVEPELTGFYAGLGYSCLQLGLDEPYLDMRAMTAISLGAGYNYNQYLALEARYTMSAGDITIKDSQGVETDTSSIDMQNIGIYVKPQYTMDQFAIYALLGYGQFTVDDGESYSEASVQYGAGINVMVSRNIGIFGDFRRLYDDDGGFESSSKDAMANSYTVGVNYNF